MKITLPNGETKSVKINLFKALDGWEIQNRFIDFASTTDKVFRRTFTLEVLSYAMIMAGEREIPLITDALIDNHLQTWQNVEAVFEEVLSLNGIDAKTHAEKPNYWSSAGAEMAISFITEAAKLMGPAMQTFNQAIKDS